MAEPARRRPGPAPSLSRDEVVSAALQVMAEDGLSAVSFRSVSRRLGVNPMALYTYVRDKDELLAAMYDTVSSGITLGDDADAPVVDQLVAYYLKARDMMLHNADLYRLVRRPDLPGADVHTAEQLCALVARLGLGAREGAALHSTLLQLTIGNALYSAAVGEPSDPDSHLVAATRAIGELDASEYPHLTATARELVQLDPEQAFADTVRSIVECAVTPSAPRRRRR